MLRRSLCAGAHAQTFEKESGRLLRNDGEGGGSTNRGGYHDLIERGGREIFKVEK
jgi:hypothetical protein